jgi:excinuclease ABC subunit C
MKGEKLKLINMAKANLISSKDDKEILNEMQNKFNLPKIPSVIEFFDMSNLGPTALVGGMTYWKDGKRIGSESKRFQIKSFEGKNDDFAAMKEVLFRRYSKLKGTSLLPDLIILDGGKGQLSSGLEVLRTLRLQIPILALAKKEEEIFSPHKLNSYRFDKTSPMMLFIRKMRDTTHNYVITYNRKKRSMKLKEQ